jgi:hypothetical protein
LKWNLKDFKPSTFFNSDIISTYLRLFEENKNNIGRNKSNSSNASLLMKSNKDVNKNKFNSKKAPILPATSLSKTIDYSEA